VEYKGGYMRKIIFILLFICVGTLSFSKSLDLTYEIKPNNDQYVINEYAMSAKTEDALLDLLMFGLVLVLIGLAILTVIMFLETGQLPPREPPEKVL
jgi:hypothetical protein